MLKRTYICEKSCRIRIVPYLKERVLAQKKYCHLKILRQCSSSSITCPFICILKLNCCVLLWKHLVLCVK